MRSLRAWRAASGVLDAGCGTGYGSAELAKNALRITGTDRSADAVGFAREHYRLPNLKFVQASVTGLPYRDASFDLVVAFEVIEHLEDWQAFLQEVRRVAECRRGSSSSRRPTAGTTRRPGERIGPNPFHVHEFDYTEFRRELSTTFPDISMFLENHAEGVVFQPLGSGEDGGSAHRRCGGFGGGVALLRGGYARTGRQTGNPTFVYLPRTANVLRERERHIALLEGELETKNGWLEKAKAELAELNGEHQKLLGMFREQQAEMERRNQWAERLNAELEAAHRRIRELQDEAVAEQAAGPARGDRLRGEGWRARSREPGEDGVGARNRAAPDRRSGVRTAGVGARRGTAGYGRTYSGGAHALGAAAGGRGCRSAGAARCGPRFALGYGWGGRLE